MRRFIEPKPTAPCFDCAVDTLPLDYGHDAEYYMVTDDLWQRATSDWPGSRRRYLCVGCIEARIGRELTPADFKDCNVNDLAFSRMQRWAWSWRTARLVSRLTGVTE